MRKENLLQEIKELEQQMIADPQISASASGIKSSGISDYPVCQGASCAVRLQPSPLRQIPGVSVLIRGGKPGKTICIRHDMDALPIQEDTGLPFQSEVDGVSHACGHDIHTAIALYCGRILNERKEELAGNVRIVFQPAEETGQGAREMMEAGFKKLSPANDIVVGLHTHRRRLWG